MKDKIMFCLCIDDKPVVYSSQLFALKRLQKMKESKGIKNVCIYYQRETQKEGE